MIFVCPQPTLWNEVWRSLCKYWEDNGRKGQKPPTPLILNGWAYTNDKEKASRWKQTIEWAEKAGCLHLIREFSDEEKYQVAQLSTYRIGPMGGPMYLDWDFSKKERPNKETEEKVLKLLAKNWGSIVGNNLAKATKPISFAGEKRRRLIVRADAKVNPPWGCWQHLDKNEKRRRSFTVFRKAINSAIAPLMVIDHIDFIHEE